MKAQLTKMKALPPGLLPTPTDGLKSSLVPPRKATAMPPLVLLTTLIDP